jgi:para-nitrobenzyl esterase
LGYSDEDKALTELMVGYWTNFAKTGDPNCAEAAECTLPDWPLYQGENWLAMEANTGKATRAVKHWRKDKLDALTEGLELKLSMLRAKTAGEMNAEPVAAGTSDLQLAVPSNE